MAIFDDDLKEDLEEVARDTIRMAAWLIGMSILHFLLTLSDISDDFRRFVTVAEETARALIIVLYFTGSVASFALKLFGVRRPWFSWEKDRRESASKDKEPEEVKVGVEDE